MPDSIDKMMDVADVYAAALHALVLPQQAVQTTHDALAQLVELAERDRTFGEFLWSSAIGVDKRAASLDKMFRGKLSDTLLNTLQVMNAHGRLDTLPAMLRCFVLRAEAAEGVVEVCVQSAVELTATQKTQAEALAAGLAKKKPIMTFVVDPEILGGLVVQIGDYRYDYSLRRQLQLAQSRFRERGDRGLRHSA